MNAVPDGYGGDCAGDTECDCDGEALTSRWSSLGTNDFVDELLGEPEREV